MIKFSVVEDPKIWNTSVQKFKEASFVVSWEWGLLQKEIGNKFLNYAVYRDEKIVGLLPVSVIEARRGKYLHLRHSPMIDWNDQEVAHESVAFLRDLADRYDSWFIRISPMLLNNEKNLELMDLYSFKDASSHETDAEHTLILDLTEDEDTLLKEMRKNTRYSIRKASKMGVEIEMYDDLSHFEEFWEIFSDAVKRNDWVAYSKEYLRKEIEVFAESDMVRMFLSKYNGEYISASLFTYFNGQSVYHHSGSLTKFRNIPSTYLLQWEAIKYAKKIGMKEHNLWGVVDKDDKTHPWYGLSLFKWGFGGKDRRMIHAHDLIISPLAYATRVYEKFENKRNGY